MKGSEPGQVICNHYCLEYHLAQIPGLDAGLCYNVELKIMRDVNAYLEDFLKKRQIQGSKAREAFLSLLVCMDAQHKATEKRIAMLKKKQGFFIILLTFPF